MADLSELESSQTVKIVGSSTPTGGVEDYYSCVDPIGRFAVFQPGSKTFYAVSNGTVVGNNKSMLSIVNTGTKVIRLVEIKIINSQTTAVTGVIGLFQLHRITSHSAGTSITPNSCDTSDTLDVGVTVRTGATVTGEGAILSRKVFSTDEWGTGTQDTESSQHIIQTFGNAWNSARGVKPWTIRQNQGIHIKFATNSSAGRFDLEFIFTEDNV